MAVKTEHGKIVVASDLHYGLGRNSRSKLRILKEYVEPAILSELEKGGTPTTLVICGDLFHEMVSVRTDIYQEARTFIRRCAELAHVVIIAGNHDCFDDTTEITSVELFEQMENVDVVKVPRRVRLYGLKCLLLPWSDRNETSLEFKSDEFDCVFCHPDVPKEFFSGLYVMENGRSMAASERNLRGMEQDALVASGLDGTNFSDGTRNDRLVSTLETVRKVITLARKGGDIFAGHIHKHSESTILSRTFRFIGSPYQTTSEEIDTSSGYYVVDASGTRFVEVRSPSFVRIRFSDMKGRGMESYDFSRVRGNIVQFDADAVISVETESMLKRKIMDEGPFEISETDYSNLVVEPNRSENAEEYQKTFAASPRACVEMYVKNMPQDVFDGENVSKDKVLDTFCRLYDFIDRKNGSTTSEGGANVVYKSMVAENFLSYESLRFDFQRYKGLTLVYGRNLDNAGATNACGKSNMIKALVYALFGRFPKKVKKENMVPWDDATKDVCVSLELESNGVAYRIESGIRKKGKESFHRVFNLSDGNELTRKQIAETRKFIETEILHCSFEMFMKTTVLTSSEIFNFYMMKKEDKDDYLNTIFGTKTLNEVRETVKGYLKDNRSEYLEATRLLESKKHDVELNRTASAKFEEDRRGSISRIESEIMSMEVQMDELRESLKVDKSETTRKLDKESRAIKSEINTLNSDIQRLRKEHSETGRKIESNNATVEIMTRELSKHKDVVPRLCQSCRKVVADGYNLSEYAKEIKRARDEIKVLRRRYEETLHDTDEAERKRDSLVKRSIELDGMIRESMTSTNETRRLESQIESRRSTLKYISEQVNPNVGILETLEADVKRQENRVEEVLSKIRHLDFVQTKVVSQEVIINQLTSKFISQLNERIRYYLQRLGLNLGVEFDNDFHYEFSRGSGAHPEFNSLSGGESLRIVIATSFAFKDFLESRRNISSNIRLLDEFFEKDTDNLGMNSTVAILKDFSRMTGQNVFLVSNKLKEIDPGVFDNVLVVSIRDGRSSIEEELVADGKDMV